MKIQGISYESLCQNLADTELCQRKDWHVNTGGKGGRADQLKYMEQNFPEKWPAYRDALDDRLSKPFDFQAILESIPKMREKGE